MSAEVFEPVEEEFAWGLCGRCGTRVPAFELGGVGEAELCLRCTKDLDEYLLAFKSEIWGRRDAGVWFFGGFGALSSLAIALIIEASPTSGPAASQQHLVSAAFVIAALVQGGFFFLQRWARWGMLALPPTGIVAGTLAGLAQGQAGEGFIAGVSWALFPGIITTYLAFNPRTKAAFKLEISDDELERLYGIHKDNRLAHYGFILSMLGLLIPAFGLVGLILSVFGLMAVDPKANPPVGKRGQAIAGLILGVLAVLKDLSIFGLTLVA